MGRIVLLSDGLNTFIGQNLLSRQVCRENLENKKIMLFYEPYYSIEGKLIDACLKLGFRKENIGTSMEEAFIKNISESDYIYVTEGNTFEILKVLREKKCMKAIKNAVERGAVYIGASAGALIAGKDIRLAADFDKNDAKMKEEEMDGLGLFDGTILPHCTKSELAVYLKKKDLKELSRYSKIYSVANGKILVLHT